MKNISFNYGGLSGAKLGLDSFDLGEGVILRKTYAHIMAHQIMAYAPPPRPNSRHPGPWKAVNSGWGYDFEIEIFVPSNLPVAKELTTEEVIWCISALLRLYQYPFINVRVLSNFPFHQHIEKGERAIIKPVEIQQRIFSPPNGNIPIIDRDMLEGLKDFWAKGVSLLGASEKLYTAFRAFDDSTFIGNTSSSLMLMWGGLEQLFAPSRGEFRFRLASYIASFLKPQGKQRLDLYRSILKLYDKRCVAAHTAAKLEIGPLAETYVLLRNILVKIISENSIPDTNLLEEKLFSNA